MNSCIFAIIKNEHLYLDEWIKYHLDLGIDHIFIFEDIDSDSHKEICDKYADKVSLNNILTVFKTEEEKLKIVEMKKNRKYVLCKYILNGLLYILRTYPNTYDWCFVIDNDEFITLEKDDTTLLDVISLYKDYDAFMLQWKCYGANGIIHKPDYSNKGLIGTYTELAKGRLNHSGIWLTKTCYNLNTFKEEHYWNLHQPSDKCKWCKTDFRHYRLRPIYNNVYIRHYITKSWEEYMWKLHIRGFLGIGTRYTDFFFELNPDLEDKKEELMKIADNIISSNK